MDFKELTPYVALYAAVVSTSVFAWDIAKWFRTRPHFRVTARAPVIYEDGAVLSTSSLPDGGTSQELAEYCRVEIVNVGGQPSTLMEIEATHRASPKSGSVFVSSGAFELRSGKQLPAKLDPGEIWSARIDMRNLKAIIQRGAPIISVRAAYRSERIVAPVETNRGRNRDEG